MGRNVNIYGFTYKQVRPHETYRAKKKLDSYMMSHLKG